MRRIVAVAICVTLFVCFASAMTCAAEQEKKKKKGPNLPTAAKGFAGMVQGKIAAVKKTRVDLKVEKVAKVWENNKAKDPESLVGQQVRIVCRKEGDKPADRQVRFLATLKAGDTVTLDVANQKRNSLTLLELTEEQRKKVE